MRCLNPHTIILSIDVTELEKKYSKGKIKAKKQRKTSFTTIWRNISSKAKQTQIFVLKQQFEASISQDFYFNKVVCVDFSKARRRIIFREEAKLAEIERLYQQL